MSTAESLPLIASPEEVVVTSSSRKSTVAVAALLSLAGIATISYTAHHNDGLKMMSMFEDVVYTDGDGYHIVGEADINVFNRDDVAFCEGSYVEGVSVRTAQRGCVAVSSQDLFAEYDDKRAIPTAHYCIGSTLDELKVDFEMIVDSGVFENPVTGYHTISQFSPGEDVDVIIFSGKNFDGQNTTIQSAQEDGRLPQKFYPDGTTANDNVQSFIIRSTADHFFIGENCGLHTQVCPMVITKEDALADQPDGCALFTTRDVGVDDEHMRPQALTKAVRVCADSEAETVLMTRDALEAMKMIHSDGDKKSQISYYNEGDKINMRYYDSSKPDDGESNLSPGSFARDKYPSGEDVNDNVYSLKMTANDNSKVPIKC